MQHAVSFTFFVVGMSGLAIAGQRTPSGTTDGDAAAVFNRRVLPILKMDRGSSCTECHFAGVELKDYIQEDQGATFAALRAEGLIDVENPDQSKILEFIQRRPDKEDELLAKVRRKEYDAFRFWIRSAVRDPKLLSRKTGVKIGSELSSEVIRHMRRDRVLQSFVDNIWSEIGRCISCHSPLKNERMVKEHGEQMSWIRPHDPLGTLDQALDQGIIDIDRPEESQMLTKPLGLEEHGGGPKFGLGSRTDKNFRRFLNDYAAVVHARYKRKRDLPKALSEVLTSTGQHLRIVDLPKGLDGKLLHVDIYRWQGDGWSRARWATADGPVAGERRLWQSYVMATAPRGSRRAKVLDGESPLPRGRYLIKVFVDRGGRLEKDRDHDLGEEDLLGRVEINGQWPQGYQPPRIVHGAQLQ